VTQSTAKPMIVEPRRVKGFTVEFLFQFERPSIKVKYGAGVTVYHIHGDVYMIEGYVEDLGLPW